MKAEIKKVAKKRGSSKALRSYAKSLVVSKNRRSQLLETKVRINSTIMQINTAAATAKVMGHLEKSTEVMKAMNQLIRLPQVAQIAQDMSREMMKFGLVEETMEDAFEMLDDAEVEEAADEEVDRVLREVLSGDLAALAGVKDVQVEEEDEDEEELEAMKARLASLDV